MRGILAAFRAVYVRAVQILPVQVAPEHPMVDSIRIEHRHDYEVEMFPQQVGSIVFLIKQKQE